MFRIQVKHSTRYPNNEINYSTNQTHFSYSIHKINLLVRLIYLGINLILNKYHLLLARKCLDNYSKITTYSIYLAHEYLWVTNKFCHLFNV